MRYGKWWAIQDATCGYSLGLHVECHTHRTNDGTPYGPYVDLHLWHRVYSVGLNPIYAGELHLLASFSRGGLSGDRN